MLFYFIFCYYHHSPLLIEKIILMIETLALSTLIYFQEKVSIIIIPRILMFSFQSKQRSFYRASNNDFLESLICVKYKNLEVQNSK